MYIHAHAIILIYSNICICLHIYHSHCLQAQACPALCDSMDYVHHAPLSMGFVKQEYQSGLPHPPPRDLPDSGIELMSPISFALSGRFFTTEPLGKSHTHVYPLVYSDSITFTTYTCMYVCIHTYTRSKHFWIKYDFEVEIEKGKYTCSVYTHTSHI